jgi:hypothetical protein
MGMSSGPNLFEKPHIIKDLLALLVQVYYQRLTPTLQLFTINLKEAGIYHIYKVIKNAKLESLG